MGFPSFVTVTVTIGDWVGAVKLCCKTVSGPADSRRDSKRSKDLI